MKATVIGCYCCLPTPTPALVTPSKIYKIPPNNAVELSPSTDELIAVSTNFSGNLSAEFQTTIVLSGLTASIMVVFQEATEIELVRLTDVLRYWGYDDYDVQSYGRRKLLFAATSIPFLVPIHQNGTDSNVVAEELVSPEYLLMKDEIRKVVSKGKAAGVLRLVFHDAGTFDAEDNSGGMNGSIIFELDRPENQGLKKSLKVLQKAKSVVDEKQPVSWADMISVAGSEAVSICGGPSITCQLGRIDSLVPDPEGKLPEESLNASGLKEAFQRKGFSTKELVALSGAHTLGSKGFGSPTTFDNSYYKILLDKPWLSSASMSSMVGLPSDRALVDDDECLRWIRMYADDQETFFQDFSRAFVKLVNSGAKWRNPLRVSVK